MPAWVMTILVRPPRSSSSTRTSVMWGARRGCPCRRAITRCRLVGHGLGVDESLVLDDLEVLAGEPHLHRAVRGLHLHAIPRLPPTRTSIFATGMVAPSGPYHALKCSGSVHICQMRPTGASKLRSITTASWELLLSVIVRACLSSWSELLEVVVHPVEAGLPDRPVLLGPVETSSSRAASSAHGRNWAVAPYDQPGPFQHLDVLRDRRQRHLERLGELVHGRRTSARRARIAAVSSWPGRQMSR